MSENHPTEIKHITVGPLATNCFVLFSSDNKAVIIDPGFEGEKIIDACKNKEVTHVLLTHGHYDHVSAVDYIRERTGAKVIIHKDDIYLYNEAHKMALLLGIDADPLNDPDILLEDERLPKDLPLDFEVLHTPGHSPGGVSYILDNHLFAGDTLFNGSIGRCDLPGGDFSEIQTSLKKLILLDDNLIVYPGHGPFSTLKEEKEINPYLLELC